MTNIQVNRTFDIDGVLDAVRHCFDDVTEDDTNIDTINAVSVDSECWLEFSLDNEILGYMQFKPYNRTTLDIHPYIYKEHRIHSKECGKLSLNWFDQCAPLMYQKLISQVPSCYRHIKRYTLGLGFSLEGTHKKAFRKNGELLDLWLFGRERLQE